jgi:hypothetical protein
MGFFLIASIGALSLVLLRLRQDDPSTSTTNQSVDSSSGGYTEDFSLPPVPMSQAPVPAPTVKPPTQEPPTAPVAGLSPTDVPVNPTTRAPSAPSSSAATTFGPSEQDPQNDFLLLLASRSIESLEELEDRDSPQYRSFEWISADPNYFDYGPDRVLQRWVLGVFFLGISDTMVTRQNGVVGFLEHWMTDIDECLWYSTRPDFVCNDQGLYERLDIRDANLYGTLPSEFALLSNSLSKYSTLC